MEKEIISKFRERPKTKIAWWAMGLGLGTLLIFPMLGIFTAVVRPIIDRASGENVGATVGFGVMIVALAISISALIVGVCAFKKGERSRIVWIGFVPAILTSALWIFMIIGEFIFPH